MALDNPFVLFPPNVWAMILGKVEDSKDIQNSFKTFPELEAVMSITRHLWMSDQAIPHLASWLKKGELLAFRQVCKPWSRAVDNFLENHPDQRPCSSPHEPLLTGQIWIPDGVPKRYQFTLPIADSVIDTPWDVSRFLALFRGHPPERNPFVGRSLSIRFSLVVGPSRYQFSLDDYVREVKGLLRKYGHHIWFIQFMDERLDTSGEFLEYFMQIVHDCVPYLPNLKSLCVESGRSRTTLVYDNDDAEEGDVEGDSRDEVAERSNEQVNPNRDWKSELLVLPHLETLQLDLEYIDCGLATLDSNLFNPLIFSFCTQLRRLRVLLHFWKEQYSNLFPNLLELTILGSEEKCCKTDFANLILKLNAPKLTTLALQRYVHLVAETDVLVWLKRFPQIRSFVLCQNHPGRGEVYLHPPTPSQLISTLTSLSLSCRANWNHDLLLYFPSLEYLRIRCVPPEEHSDSDSDQEDQEEVEVNQGGRSEPTVKLSQFLQSGDVYGSNVWELLPKLKTVTVVDIDEEDDESAAATHFTRAMYDHLKREANQQ